VPKLIIAGGGLAGSEAAWQAAHRGIKVRLYEMRPKVPTGAHATSNLAELVCSNSLGSNMPDRASGLLQAETKLLGSLLLKIAEDCALPAGSALAVDREAFAKKVTEQISKHPNIEIVREELIEIPSGPAIIATGPLTSPKFSQAIAKLTGQEHLYFFDAISPIVASDSIDMKIAFRASRYDRGQSEEGDYINCPFEKDRYEAFVNALITAEQIPLKNFESKINTGIKAGDGNFFEGCLPIEVLGKRDPKALAFGPMRPVGLINPNTGKRPYAVVQLRQDNVAATLYNIVGFQTNLKFPEQERIFKMIPGLENAEFIRHGQMHRNTYIASPKLLQPTLQAKNREDLFFAGQITGVEGYVGNIATGLLAGQNAARLLLGEKPIALPQTTMLGALCHYITHCDPKHFQPMKANLGLLPPLPINSNSKSKQEKGKMHHDRSLSYLREPELTRRIVIPAKAGI